MEYRRVHSPGGTFFFTVLTFNRQTIFNHKNARTVLRDAFQHVRKNHPFTIDAIVLLPDHLHTIWTLPEDDGDYPTRWRLIKSYFTRNWKDRPIVQSASRIKKGEQAVWQRRYWEHQIRDEDDFIQHVEYIHYNPVKHELVSAPHLWSHSSFHDFVKRGVYEQDWGAA
jgi:putative transposase